MSSQNRLPCRGRSGAARAAGVQSGWQWLIIACAAFATTPVKMQAQEMAAEFDRYEFAASGQGDQFCRPIANAPLTLNGDTITFDDRYPCASGLNVTGTVTLSRPQSISGVIQSGQFVPHSAVTPTISAQATFKTGTAALHKTRVAAGITFQDSSQCNLQPSDETGMGANSTLTKDGSGACTLAPMSIDYEGSTPKETYFVSDAFITVQTT